MTAREGPVKGVSRRTVKTGTSTSGRAGSSARSPRARPTPTRPPRWTCRISTTGPGGAPLTVNGFCDVAEPRVIATWATRRPLTSRQHLGQVRGLATTIGGSGHGPAHGHGHGHDLNSAAGVRRVLRVSVVVRCGDVEVEDGLELVGVGEGGLFFGWEAVVGVVRDGQGCAGAGEGVANTPATTPEACAG